MSFETWRRLAGWLVGIFYAAYFVAVPALVALTDRVTTRNN
jgi:hypothetical protein